MNKSDILSIVCAEGEGQKIEFKAKTTALAKEFVAFANASGGSLFLGISDDGEIAGVDDSNRLRSQIQDVAKPLRDIIIWPGVEKLILISGGRTIHSSAELLGSRYMKALAQEMKTRYNDRYVLFDAPPVLMGADVIALAPCVDSIVMVVEKGKTTNSDVKKAVEMLPQEKFLGFVMNRNKPYKKKDGYYYR